ncbi:MAG: NAD(P)/FAD-dependent oxidoreductase [Rhodovarius sp.]|nr:NAD(P)/FAD-dependent oxidoreductase [Rhodovarius sp.]MCX7931318.1 NAD(P)/FAD-dependent oxidoreductase [Rhodovarius sp.]
MDHIPTWLEQEAAARLAALARRVAWELETLSYPAREWVRPPPSGALQVAIVGGGQTGLALAFALWRSRIGPIEVIEALPEGQSAVWTGFARMHALRTPKHVLGPELGVPSLSLRAWYEARFGEAAWAALQKVPRTHWQEYLDWLRRTLRLPLAFGWRVQAIRPPDADGLFTLAAADRAGRERVWRARHVVLATGMDGMGAWRAPAEIAALPRRLWAHTAEPIAPDRLAGRRVLVVGAGASAFDNAALALEAGAASVTLLARRAELPRVNPNRWMEFAGFLEHYADLPDATKWRWLRRFMAINQPPPQESWNRCARHRHFRIVTGAPLLAARPEGAEAVLETPRGVFRGDFVIAGTGLVIDLSARPELSAIAPHIAFWRDRYTPPPGEEDELLGGFPYLDGSFALTGDAPWLSRIRSYGYAAFLSMGCSGGISTLGPAVRRMADGIRREIFLSQAPQHEAELFCYAEAELTDLRLSAEEDTR